VSTRDELHPYTSAELRLMPTLAVGQAEDLKAEDGDLRWWLSRCTLADGATHRVSCERLTAGRWVISGEFEPFEEPESRYDPDAPSVNEQAQRSYYDKYYGS